MVGLVIVSHSRALADALVGLLQQVASKDVSVAVAAGVGPDRSEFGTDAIEITEAIQSVYSNDGVVVLMDLGSAILSAEMALELLPEEMQKKIRFCAAPLVEGAIAAAVQAGLGSDMEAVCQEAQQALAPKLEQLGVGGVSTVAEAASEAVALPEEKPQEVILTLQNMHGLHARPAARFVQTAAAFEADIKVHNLRSGKGPVSARSLNALATLGAVRGDRIAVSATGVQAGQALQALTRLVEDNFGETEAEVIVQPQATVPVVVPGEGQPVVAIPVSEGVAAGPMYRFQPPTPPIPDETADNPDFEWERLERALDVARQAIQKRQQQMAASIGQAQTAIFDAHLLILDDPEMLAEVRSRIFRDHENAARAWNESIMRIAETYRQVADAYLQQRAVDVLDVGNQVLFVLAGKAGAAKVEFPEPVILFAEELTPTETSQLDMSRVLGIATVGGGPTSHSAILARAMGIPAVAGIDPALVTLPPGTRVGLDGFNGWVWIEPAPEVEADISKRRESWLEQRAKLVEASSLPAVTKDGHLVEVAANIGNIQDAELAVKNGAEGIGLLRTEFLFLTRETSPSEEEQFESLRKIGIIMGERPVIVRTLDVGGDKDLPYIDLQPEANPFLGVRAIRLAFKIPDLFRTQLRAILRAAGESNIRVMFPMVARAEEVMLIRQHLEEAHQSLLAENIPHNWPIQAGIMVEIPAAAILSPVLAKYVDFFSIGTNDLTQYTLAAERGNPGLSGLADALHPAVLALIRQVVEAAHNNGKWVGVCGELAGEPAAVPVLAGLGVDELSLNPGGIPRVKAILREISFSESQALAEQVLHAEDAPAARRLAERFLEERFKKGSIAGYS